MKVQRIIIADNQPITAYAIEKLASEINPDIVIEYSTHYQDLKHKLQTSETKTAVFLDYTLFDFAKQEYLTIVAESMMEKVNWLLISEDLTTSFLHYVLCKTQNIGVVFKDESIDSLKTAIRDTLDGDRYVSQNATKILLQRAYKEEQCKDTLTQTEREVLKLIALGKTTKEIAAERFSSIHTINSHRKNIFRKLNVNCAHDAKKYALRAGLVEESEFYI